MFEKFINLLGRSKNTMLDRSIIKAASESDILMSDEMSSAIRLWSDMYTDAAGLHLPQAIAAEMARMITIELKSEVTGGSRADYLNSIYQGLVENLRIPVEYGCALGGTVFKPYVRNGEMAIDCVRADEFFPVSFDDSGRITGAIFVQRIREGNAYYTRLERHKLSGTVYTIDNRAFKSISPGTLGHPVSLGEVSVWQGMGDSVSIGNVSRPLFGYFKPAGANTVDLSSPLGVSVFSGTVNLIEDANRQYNRYLWEFESGERALIANAMAFKLDKDGKPRLPDKRLYKTLDVDDIDFFREWSPRLRESDIARGMDRIFRQIEFGCGLAYGTLSEVNDTEKTAEEIRTSKQRSYTSVADNQKSLKNALCDLVYAMDVWCTLYSLAPMGTYSVSFDFDDSIAADRKTEFEEKQKLVEAGIMAPWEFRMWYFGEDEETAKKHIFAPLHS